MTLTHEKRARPGIRTSAQTYRRWLRPLRSSSVWRLSASKSPTSSARIFIVFACRTQRDRKAVRRLAVAVLRHRIRALDGAQRGVVPCLVSAASDHGRTQQRASRRAAHGHDGLQARRIARPDDIRANAPQDLFRVARTCQLGRCCWSGRSTVPLYALKSRHLGARFVVTELP
jgi:hypothetical protein